MTRLIGMMLVDGGKISVTQLSEAVSYQVKNGGEIGGVLIEMGYIDEKTLEEYLIKQRELRERDKEST